MEDIVRQARELASDILRDVQRSNGHPFIEHPDSVAAIVRDEIGLTPECQAAVYLHEATRCHPEVSLEQFPEDIRKIVEGLNLISTIKPKDTRLEAENYKRLIVQYSSDPRVTVIKIADRLEIMRSLAAFPKSSREQKLLETLMLYIPLAHQLGLYNIKSELEDIWFRYSDPEQYRAITNKLKSTEKDREALSRDFVQPLAKTLSEAGIKYKLKVRTKTAYSIYKKMQAQHVPFEGVYDVFAMRFIIDCEPDRQKELDLCWKVYSYVTQEYIPDTSRLRDWLTQPKPNGYESLHITVSNRQGHAIEVQIRTRRMDEIAESGLASHWSYKGISGVQTLNNWLTSVRYNLEHKSETRPEDMPKPPQGEIFVFTPTGELRILPQGASVLDFAFNIHSGLGCRCTGARISGKAVSIREPLKTGDVVEILTSRNQHPSHDWLSWVVTGKARTKIRQELDAEERKKAAQGRELLERRLKNWKLDFPDDMVKDFMKSRKYTSVISLMAAIADGDIDVNDVKSFILKETEAKVSASASDPARLSSDKPGSWTAEAATAASSDSILVLNARNVKGMDYKMAKCCNPVFGDDVFGFVTRGEGIKIHRISCPNASRLIENYPYRIQKVRWVNTGSDADFQCSLAITADLEHSVMGDIMNVIGQFKASVRSFNVNENRRSGTYDISVRLMVPSNMELDKILSQLSSLRHIQKVHRI